MKTKIKMRIVDWWAGNTKEDFYKNYFIKILQDKYDVIYSDDPDFLLYGPFGKEHLKYHCVRIFYTGENVRTNWNIADYGIDFDFMDFGERHLRMPLWGQFSNRKISKPIKFKKAKKFCSLLVSNGGQWRDEAFRILNTYKRVDSGGAWENNLGYRVKDKQKWLEQYKFNLCFENSSYPGYLTEKLFDAFSAGCIPIYWGDRSLRCEMDDVGGGVLETNYLAIDTSIPKISPHLIDYYINPKSFINAHAFPTLEALLDEVKRIDNDEQAYLSMLHEPIFLDAFDMPKYYHQKIFAFLDSILSQDPQQAYRRGEGQRLGYYKNFPIKQNITQEEILPLQEETKSYLFCIKQKAKDLIYRLKGLLGSIRPKVR